MPSDDSPPGTDALIEYLDAHYGDRFDAERREELHDAVSERLEAAEAVREVDLANDDPPAFAFGAYRSED